MNLLNQELQAVAIAHCVMTAEDVVSDARNSLFVWFIGLFKLCNSFERFVDLSKLCS